MASTYTTRIGLEKQADGENANTWGLRLNTNVIDLVDEAAAGYETITLSGGSTPLTDTQAVSNQARNMGLKFNGTLSADCTVVIPATEKVYFVHNSTAGAFNVYLKPSGGTAIKVVDQGESMMVGSDGVTINVLEGKTSVAYATSAGFAASAGYATSAGTASFATSATNATNATNATKVYVTNTGTAANYKLVFVSINGGNGQESIFTDSTASFYYNPSSNTLTLGGSLGVGGNITASGDVVAYSDQKLKENIETLDGNKAFNMRGVSFIKEGKEGSGVIAQELEQIAPELVNNSGEYKAVAYGNVVGYLIEAVKLLKAEIEELKGNK